MVIFGLRDPNYPGGDCFKGFLFVEIQFWGFYYTVTKVHLYEYALRVYIHFYTHIDVSTLYVYACLYYLCLYIICRGWGVAGGDGGWVKVKRSKGYILYMYFLLRVVYYTYIHTYSINAFEGCMHICSVVRK